MAKPKQIQQGDVLLQQIDAIPAGAKPVPNEGRVIVARGEQTGHTHVIKSDQAGLWELTRDGVTDLYLEVKTPVTLVHEEHKPLPIPPGIYMVGRVKEYDYFADMERRVRD